MLFQVLSPIPLLSMMLLNFVCFGNPVFLAVALCVTAILVRTVHEEIAWREFWEAER